MKETSLFRPTIKRALKIAWNYKFLWFFGIFTALVGGSEEFQAVFRSLDGLSAYQTTFEALQNGDSTGTLAQIWNLITDAWTTQTGQVIFWFIVFLILALVLMAIIVASQAALVDSAGRALQNKPVNLDSAWLGGVTHFWRMLGLTAFEKAVVWLLYLVMTVPLALGFYFTEGAGWNIALVLLSVLVFLPIAVVVSFVVRYAQSYAVIENKSFSDSLAASWKLFRAHWVVSVEMAIVIFLLTIVFYLLLVLGVALVTIPFFGIALVISVFGLEGVSVVISDLGIIAAILWIVLAGAFTSVFQWAAWVTFFMEIRDNGAKSKLANVVDRLPIIFRRKKNITKS